MTSLRTRRSPRTKVRSGNPTPTQKERVGEATAFRHAAPLAPVSVIIADVVNSTGDDIFDRTVESIVKSELERAPFIATVGRAQLAVPAGTPLSESAATQLAVKQSIGAVLLPAVERRDGGFLISLKAVRVITAELIVNVVGTARNKGEFVRVLSRSVAKVREAFGDSTSDVASLLARVNLSTSSLEAVRQYTLAQDAASKGRFEEARAGALKAIELDPKFGTASCWP